MFKPDPQIQSIAIDAGSRCYVIDEALCDPDALVEHAARHWERAAESGFNAFPGPELRMDEAFSEQLVSYFNLHLRSRLGARRTLRSYSRLSMVTRTPEQLAAPQWICHRDRLSTEPGTCIAACVLYLFHDPALGGTGFYRSRLSEPETALLVHHSGALEPAEFAARYGLTAGYMTQSNASFEKLLSIPARYNRLIFYDGMVFHCSDIDMPQRLHGDPRQGRLTLNGFFTCSRRQAA